ncbi:MAG: hypothetical protein AB1896_23490, partial [Thermodesulfobacteriota bacterium]
MVLRITEEVYRRLVNSNRPGTSLLTGPGSGPEGLVVGPEPKPKKELPPELALVKARIENEKEARDFIKASTEMAQEARAFREEQQKVAGYEARGTTARMWTFLEDLEARYRKKYARQLESERFRTMFEHTFAEVQNGEMRRASWHEVQQRKVERAEILRKDIERRRREVREDPDRLAEYLK